MKPCFVFLLLIILVSCKFISTPVDKTLESANANRKELETVIHHYKQIGDKEKLEAAYYLIANMKDKYSLEGEGLNVYFKIYEDILSKYNSGIRKDNILDSLVNVKIDSLESYYGKVEYDKLEKRYDASVIKADSLIASIDLAFDTWKNKAWAKHISFDQFCEFILPYRVWTEKLQYWRPFLYNKYKFLCDSLKDPRDPKEITHKLCDYIYKDWKHLDNFSRFGYFSGIKEIDRYKAGICEHHYAYLTAVLRSFGIAVAIESAPQWKNWTDSHSWMMLIDTTGKPVFFNPGNPHFVYTQWVPLGRTHESTKVFRHTFTIQNSKRLKKAIEDGEFITPYFTDLDKYDVSADYTYPQLDVTWPVSNNTSDVVFLSAFNYAFFSRGADWTIVDNHKVTFKNVGYPGIYLLTYSDHNEDHALLNPIAIDKNKKMRILNPDTLHRITVMLRSKFPMDDSMLLFSIEMVGAKFQASSSPGFENPTDLFTIHDTVEYLDEKETAITRAFRYVRYLSAPLKRINAAEIGFYTKDDKDHERIISGRIIGAGEIIKGTFKNVFDSDIKTNLTSAPGSWVGFDLGSPRPISRIRYLPRNDLNIVEIGDIYELFYYDNGPHSLGRQIANKNYLIYEKVPGNALLVLSDVSKGKQERVFTYENNRQYWW